MFGILNSQVFQVVPGNQIDLFHLSRLLDQEVLSGTQSC